LFCKILARQIPAKIVHEDAEVFAFEDINPQSPTHVLVCPKKHFASLDHASAGEEAVLGKLALVAAKIARERKLASYRAVINTGSEAGQSVFHLHLHLLGGRTFAWPPG
jgi:histidine triad (HIT) family protein